MVTLRMPKEKSAESKRRKAEQDAAKEKRRQENIASGSPVNKRRPLENIIAENKNRVTRRRELIVTDKCPDIDDVFYIWESLFTELYCGKSSLRRLSVNDRNKVRSAVKMLTLGKDDTLGGFLEWCLRNWPRIKSVHYYKMDNLSDIPNIHFILSQFNQLSELKRFGIGTRKDGSSAPEYEDLKSKMEKTVDLLNFKIEEADNVNARLKDSVTIAVKRAEKAEKAIKTVLEYLTSEIGYLFSEDKNSPVAKKLVEISRKLMEIKE